MLSTPLYCFPKRHIPSVSRRIGTESAMTLGTPLIYLEEVVGETMDAQHQRVESCLRQSDKAQTLHELSARHFGQINRSLSIIVATLAVCASLLMFLTSFQLEPVRWIQLLAACVSLIAAGISAGPILLHGDDRVQRHCIAGARYAEMSHELQHLAQKPQPVTDSHAADVCDRLTLLTVRSPEVPLSVIRRAKREPNAHRTSKRRARE